jgi:hypothetical protein
MFFTRRYADAFEETPRERDPSISGKLGLAKDARDTASSCPKLREPLIGGERCGPNS